MFPEALLLVIVIFFPPVSVEREIPDPAANSNVSEDEPAEKDVPFDLIVLKELVEPEEELSTPFVTVSPDPKVNAPVAPPKDLTPVFVMRGFCPPVIEIPGPAVTE